MSPRDDGTEEQVIECDYLVNAAGPWAGDVTRMTGIGKNNHHCQKMRTGLPVEPRLRSIFTFKSPNGPTNSPLVIDGAMFWRRERNGVFLTGLSPPPVYFACVTLTQLCRHVKYYCIKYHGAMFLDFTHPKEFYSYGLCHDCVVYENGIVS